MDDDAYKASCLKRPRTTAGSLCPGMLHKALLEELAESALKAVAALYSCGFVDSLLISLRICLLRLS